MTSRSRTLGLVAALAALAALAGCGGSSGKSDFAKKADALCAATNRANPTPSSPRNAKQAAAQQAKEIQIRTKLDQQLKALSVPSDAKANFDAYNAGTQRIIAAITKLKADADKNNRTAYGADNQAVTAASSAREKTAIKLGFKTCGRRNPAG
jgi:glucose/arabinose dehydrogenase